MAFINIFKKKKKVKKKAEKKKAVKKPEVKEPVKKKVKEPVKVIKPKKVSLIASLVLKEPHVTEKATDLIKKNQYVFKVQSKANKKDVKKSVEEFYGVSVVSVKIINIHPKERRLGKTIGQSSGYKKAIIKIEQGQKIEVLPR